MERIKETINSICDKFGIEKRYIKPKLVYFLIFAAQVSLVPFSPVYFKYKEISDEMIGVLGALPPWMAFLGAPVATAIADKFDIHKLVMLICFVVATILSFSVMFFDKNSVGILITLILVASFLDAPVFALLDNAVMEILGPNKAMYGQQRLWGAVSFGLVAPLVGGLILLHNWIYVMFISYIIFRVLTFFVLIFLDVRSNDLSQGFVQNLKVIVIQPRIICFLITIFMIGINMGFIGVFLFVFLQEHLKADYFLLGLTVLVTCTAEVIYFLFSHRIQALIGHQGVIYASFIAYIVRFIYYSLIENPWVVLGAEILHGLTFGGMWSSSVAYADELAPKGMGATLQGLLTGVCFGLGGGSGSLLGGIIYSRIGPQWTFRVMACWSALGLLFFFLSNFILDKVSKRKDIIELHDSVEDNHYDEETVSLETNESDPINVK